MLCMKTFSKIRVITSLQEKSTGAYSMQAMSATYARFVYVTYVRFVLWKKFAATFLTVKNVIGSSIWIKKDLENVGIIGLIYLV